MYELIHRQESESRKTDRKPRASSTQASLASEPTSGMQSGNERLTAGATPEEIFTQRIHRMLKGEDKAPRIQKQSQPKLTEFTPDLPNISRAAGAQSSVSTVSPQTESKIQSMKSSGGEPLDNSTRQFMEPRMGHDFSSVRVHTGGDAQTTSNELNAKAYTIGNDIAFNKGEYQPGTAEGKKLIAHELTHTIQQGGVQRKEKPGLAIIQRDPFAYPFRRPGQLSPEELQHAIAENRKLVKYDEGLIWELYRISGNKTLWNNAWIDAFRLRITPHLQIGEAFVYLVQDAQRKLSLKPTGILDRKTQREGRKFRKLQDALEISEAVLLILKSSQSGRYSLERENVIHQLLKARAKGLLGRVLKDLRKKASTVGQSPGKLFPWMYRQLKKDYREQFFQIILKAGYFRDLAKIRAKQISDSKDAEDTLHKLLGMRGRLLEETLRILEGKRSDPYDIKARDDETHLANWLFQDKLASPLQREKLRRYFHDQRGLGQLLAAVHAAHEIFRLLKTKRRIESDDGIVFYFRTTPIKERESIMVRLAMITRKADGFHMSAEKALQSRMLPAPYKHLQDLGGMRLYAPPRKLSAAEEKEVADDRRRIWVEVAKAIPMGVVKGALRGIWALVKGIILFPWDIGVMLFDLVMTYAYFVTYGEFGINNYVRVAKAFSGIKEFASDPFGMTFALLQAAYEDSLLASKAEVGPGSTGRAVEFWVSGSVSFIVQVATIAAAAKKGVKSIIRRLKALKRVKRLRRIRSERLKKEFEAKKGRFSDKTKGITSRPLSRYHRLEIKPGGKITICTTCEEMRHFYSGVIKEHTEFEAPLAAFEKQSNNLYHILAEADKAGRKGLVDKTMRKIERLEMKIAGLEGDVYEAGIRMWVEHQWGSKIIGREVPFKAPIAKPGVVPGKIPRQGPKHKYILKSKADLELEDAYIEIGTSGRSKVKQLEIYMEYAELNNKREVYMIFSEKVPKGRIPSLQRRAEQLSTKVRFVPIIVHRHFIRETFPP